jgi:type II restriction/modification system DNA methylase subunit YeeA
MTSAAGETPQRKIVILFQYIMGLLMFSSVNPLQPTCYHIESSVSFRINHRELHVC